MVEHKEGKEGEKRARGGGLGRGRRRKDDYKEGKGIALKLDVDS